MRITIIYGADPATVTPANFLVSDISTTLVGNTRRLNEKGDVIRFERSNKTRVDGRTYVGKDPKTDILMIQQEEVYR